MRKLNLLHIYKQIHKGEIKICSCGLLMKSQIIVVHGCKYRQYYCPNCNIIYQKALKED